MAGHWLKAAFLSYWCATTNQKCAAQDERERAINCLAAVGKEIGSELALYI